ncbi:MAG TPA: polyribonucleotide nucleotidyltransferase, partial [Pontiellaceae bacterium]|nr:polyribonucleotide nucleotidyltransferase [Pontiellaceae bacterium]
MKNTVKIQFEVGGKPMFFESGLLAQQAAGAVSCGLGDNIVFSAVTATNTPREGVDFFPLQVEYREKFYAAGRFPGGFFKREARPSEKEILTARVTDRPLRPLFPKGYCNDVQINNMLLSCDGQIDTDFLSVNASSAALVISEVPFMGPIAAIRIGRVNGQFIICPTHEQLAKSDLDLTYAGTAALPLMIEGSAKEISEADFVAAMKLAHEAIQPIIAAQLELRKQLGLPEKKIEIAPADEAKLVKAREIAGAELLAALATSDKLARQEKISAIKKSLKVKLLEVFPEMADNEYFHLFDELEIETVRKNVLEHKTRVGGRGFNELRELKAQIGVLPRVHGSAVFNRGETQSLAIVTLGPKKDSQSIDAVTGGELEKNFMLHYNFPPYSVGEVGRLGTTGRREIGHGNLAERSLRPVMPDNYPYAVRVVSEIMGSNGSSSMASACVGTLALMDAGVPIKKPVGGISVGLFTGENGKADLVLDILGTEDHCGDMDFKVCGTRDGITGFQVDLKIDGLRWDLVEGAFEMARKGRMDILDYMESVIAAPRAEMSEYAPRIVVIKIDPEKIGALIGPGGKVIRGITDTYGVQIDIEEDGTVNVFSSDANAMKAAVKAVNAITAEAEIGQIYEGTVKTIRDFGAFVEIMPGKDGLVHISELADFRVGKVEDICKEGDIMWVKVLDVDRDG